jgi:hypothetical protein
MLRNGARRSTRRTICDISLNPDNLLAERESLPQKTRERVAATYWQHAKHML